MDVDGGEGEASGEVEVEGEIEGAAEVPMDDWLERMTKMQKEERKRLEELAQQVQERRKRKVKLHKTIVVNHKGES